VLVLHPYFLLRRPSIFYDVFCAGPSGRNASSTEVSFYSFSGLKERYAGAVGPAGDVRFG
ncbi:hypothetical protein, partial [Proteus mirabilis]|uniref:hypothetical protein n=1 Tax=Proteus mirabilis TaxID=584 RepID=UPI001C12FF44